MNTIKLSDEELVLLASVVPRFSADADAASERLEIKRTLGDVPADLQPVVSRILQVALENSAVDYGTTDVRYCSFCKTSAGYHTYTRNSRYHRKGEPNYKRPKRLWGARVNGETMCMDCWRKIQPTIVSALRDRPVYMPPSWDEDRPLYAQFNNMECTKCGWTGHEGEMGRDPTMMGDGYYPAKCPECGAENKLFTTDIKRAKGTTVIRVPKSITITTVYGKNRVMDWRRMRMTPVKWPGVEKDGWTIEW